jgi:hypothetical protein
MNRFPAKKILLQKRSKAFHRAMGCVFCCAHCEISRAPFSTALSTGWVICGVLRLTPATSHIPPIRSQFVGTPVSSPKQPVVLRFFPGGGVSSPGTNACALFANTPNTQQCLSATHTHFETAHILLQRWPRTSSQQRIKLLPFGSSLKTAHRLELIPVPHELTRILSCVCFLLMSPRSTVSHGTCSVTMCDGLRVPAAAAHVIRQDAVCVDIELPSKTY